MENIIMAFKVDQTLTGQENLFALVQATWPAHAAVLTPENVTVEGGVDVASPTSLGVVVTGISASVINSKTATYTVTNLDAAYDIPDVDSAEEAKLLVEAFVEENFACLLSEVVVSEAVEEDGEFVVTISATDGAVTCQGTGTARVALAVHPLNLETDLVEDQLDGFSQVV